MLTLTIKDGSGATLILPTGETVRVVVQRDSRKASRVSFDAPQSVRILRDGARERKAA